MTGSSRNAPQGGTSPLGEVKRSAETRVDKPWGYEIRWAVTDRYLGKILHINRGEALSLQYHERKDECILLVQGAIDFESGPNETALRTVRMKTGDSIHITP